MSTETPDDHARLLGQWVMNPSIMMNENPRSVNVLGVACRAHQAVQWSLAHRKESRRDPMVIQTYCSEYLPTVGEAHRVRYQCIWDYVPEFTIFLQEIYDYQVTTGRHETIKVTYMLSGFSRIIPLSSNG